MLLRRTLFALASAAVLAAPLAVQAEEKLTIVTTTGMIADAARAVGGDLVEVTALMGPGVDPHAYRQTRSDIVAMVGADLVLWNGLYLEAQLEGFLLNLSERQPVVAVAQALSPDALIAHEDYAGRFDPHVWMDPALWVQVVNTTAMALSDLSPENAAVFAGNAARYIAETESLARYAQDVLATVPEASHVLISAHDAFGYFGAAYGFEVIGIQGISTESEAGLQRIAALVDLLVTRDVRAVFVETSVSDRNIRALIEGAASRGHEVVIGAGLYSDAMGAPETYEGTWIGMIDHNVTAIARALGGQAPEAGLAGRLNIN